MRIKPGLLLAIALFLTGLSAAPAQPTYFTAGQRASLITSAEAQVGKYTYPDKIPALRAVLEDNRAALLTIDDPNAFARAVTADLYAVSRDRHLALSYSEAPIPTNGGQSDAALALHLERQFELADFGLTGVLLLQGNIGYLRLKYFGTMPASKAAIDSAMTMLAHTDALIVDDRDNHGGDASSLHYLLSYFLKTPTQLTGIVKRTASGNRLFKAWSSIKVDGPKYIGKSIFVLTSIHTFSAGEAFAYDMKTLHRATLLGETTGGAANPGQFFSLDDHFSIFVPTGHALNPFTQTNWEGVGVTPDVQIAAADALLAAYDRALLNSNDSFDTIVAQRTQALKDPKAALEASLPRI